MKRKRKGAASSVENLPKNSTTRFPPWTSLNNDILATCFSYCNAADLLSLRRSNGVFRQAARLVVSRAESLHLSTLRASELYKKADDRLVACLLEDAGASLQYLELSGLRKIRGEKWLVPLLRRCRNLTSLNLIGCSRLDPRLFQSAVEASTANMIHLNLTGCRKIDRNTVTTIVTTWTDLETLLLSGCSQTIDGTGLYDATLPKFRSLDLSGLNRIRNFNAFFLPACLEHLSVAGCEQISFILLNSIAERVLPLLVDQLEGGNFRMLAEHVRSGNMEEFWSALTSALDEYTREMVRKIRQLAGRETVLHSGWPHLRALDMSHCGLPYDRGLIGLLSCLSGGSLREVNVSGYDHLTDDDVKMLAVNCANSLTSFEAHACTIGDDALTALGAQCENLAYLDVSACSDITDAGINALVPCNGVYSRIDDEDDNALLAVSSPSRGCRGLRTLKLASLPNVTDDAVLWIAGVCNNDLNGGMYRSEDAGLKKLMLLDVRDCTNISAAALEHVIEECPLLVEVEARGTSGRVSRDVLPTTLRFLNGRRLPNEPSPSGRCCTVMRHSQRIKASQGVALQPMFHCVDCKLLPPGNRGMCSVCASVCHKGHRTYFGSMERFYCDCAYGIAGGEGCKALLPEESSP